MTLYSKDSIKKPVDAMCRTGRFVHSCIITGDEGTGKKTSARYLAMALLCDNKNACGTCRQCSRILRGQHPDFIEVAKEKRIYSVSDIRSKVVEDCYIAPNDCDRKVYLLSDCEGWTDASQDALLKITEDPPETAYFIFTARNRSFFLPTLISRSMVLEVHEADEDGCRNALAEYARENGRTFDDKRINDAVSAFGGNIGRCIDYLEGNDKLIKAAEAVRKCAGAIAAHDEYSLAATLHSVSADRDEMKNTLSMLAKAIRDSAVMRNGGRTVIGCAYEESSAIAGAYPSDRLLDMYEAVCAASDACLRNCNTAAAAAVLAGKLLYPQ